MIFTIAGASDGVQITLQLAFFELHGSITLFYLRVLPLFRPK